MSIEAVTKEYLVTLFSEFVNSDSERVIALNDVALLFVEEGVFGDKSRYALACMIAHMLKMSDMQGVGGPVIAHSVGDISESFARPDKVDSTLSLTSYGQEYRRIARQKSAAIRQRFYS